MLRVLQLLLHAAQGLQELHGQNVVHGDLVSCQMPLLSTRSASKYGAAVELLS
jgi:hypothetical protein